MKSLDPKDDELKRLLEMKRVYSESEEYVYIQSVIYMMDVEDDIPGDVRSNMLYDKFKPGVRVK